MKTKKQTVEVRVYTKSDCQYCDFAKEMLTERGIKFDERDVGVDYVLRGWLAWATGQRTLPQIFIAGEPIGGFADLMTLDAEGELMTCVFPGHKPDGTSTEPA